VHVPTPEAAVNLKVPEGAQSGQVVRLRGKGVARKGRPAGDLYVHFLIQIPTARSEEVTKLVDELAKSQEEDPRVDIHL
jgi:curved DNA-binding protein